MNQSRRLKLKSDSYELDFDNDSKLKKIIFIDPSDRTNTCKVEREFIERNFLATKTSAKPFYDDDQGDIAGLMSHVTPITPIACFIPNII